MSSISQRWGLVLVTTLLSTCTRLHGPLLASGETISLRGGGGETSSVQSIESNNNNNQHRHLKDDNPTAEFNLSGWPTSLVWLVSYPQSRASYTIRTVQMASQKSAAVNYKDHYPTNFPPPKNEPENHPGPYQIRPDLSLPATAPVLTETHCIGTCLNTESCSNPPFISSLPSFIEGCAAGPYLEEDRNRESVTLYHPRTSIDRIVHQIRDPFDNIVHRFNEDCRRYRFAVKTPTCPYSDDRIGLQAWCRDFASRPEVQEGLRLNDRLTALAQQVPCFAVFYQYVLWHNNVGDMVKEMDVPVFALHYDDFERNVGATTQRLLQFLDLSVASDGTIPLSPPTTPNYSNHFSLTDRGMVSSFIKVVASQSTWSQMKRYLPVADYEKRFSPLGQILSPVHYGSWPEIAWLMTFPNSGTGYVTQIIQRLTGGTATASNYGNEMKAIYQDIPNFSYTDAGPFRTNKNPFPSNGGAILTKTHCKHCMNCLPQSSDIEINLNDFIEGCTRTGVMEGDKSTMGHYDAKIAKKIVHVLRNPFDNIVANFHYQYKRDVSRKGRSQYTYDRAGFREWCLWHDEKYTEDDFFLYGSKAAKVAKTIPCHGVFFQYIQWHNNAFRTPLKLKIPSYVLYYEDFHFNRKEVITQLLDFLKLERVKNAPEFHYSPYPDHYTKKELKAARDFLRMVGSSETIEALERYFK